MNLDLLAIGAHPDDVELGCGGTVAKSIKQGYSVGIIDITKGELGTRGTPTIRAREAKHASTIFGTKIRENLYLPDGQIEVNKKNILKLVVIIRKYRPKVLLIPHWMERHPDHVHTHHLAREAWFYSGLRKIKSVYKGRQQEAWRPENYFHYMQWHEFNPTFIIDISDTYGQRIDAIKAHRSQFFNPASKEPQTILSQKAFLDFVETRAKAYGHKIGVEYGEPFYSVEAIGMSNLFTFKMFKG